MAPRARDFFLFTTTGDKNKLWTSWMERFAMPDGFYLSLQLGGIQSTRTCEQEKGEAAHATRSDSKDKNSIFRVS